MGVAGLQLKPQREVVGSSSPLRPTHHALAGSACRAVGSQACWRGVVARAQAGGVAVLLGGARLERVVLLEGLLLNFAADRHLGHLCQAASARVQRRANKLLLVLQAGGHGWGERVLGGKPAGRQAGRQAALPLAGK